MQECAVMNVRASKTPGTPTHADENCANNVESSLSDQEKSKFRGTATRINYLAQDQADLQFAAKDLGRHMASLEVHDWEKAKRIARYLKGKPRAIQHFAFGKIAPQLDGFTDSDWAGERPSMKSASGGILMWGGCLIKSWSSTQTTIELSGGGIVRNEQVRPARIISGERRL